MTKRELVEKLAEFPDDMEMGIACDVCQQPHTLSKLTYDQIIVDTDYNLEIVEK